MKRAKLVLEPQYLRLNKSYEKHIRLKDAYNLEQFLKRKADASLHTGAFK